MPDFGPGHAGQGLVATGLHWYLDLFGIHIHIQTIIQVCNGKEDRPGDYGGDYLMWNAGFRMAVGFGDISI